MIEETTDPTPKRSRKSTELPPMPVEMLDALGGAPIRVPPMAARRVTPGDRLAGHAASTAPVSPARVTNALFDDPGPDLRTAAKRLREVRAAYGKVAQQMDEAARLLRAATDLDCLGEAAVREGFDLDAAIAVAREFEDFLDRHKPVTA